VEVDADNGQVLGVRSVAVDGVDQPRTADRTEVETDFTENSGPVTDWGAAHRRLQARRAAQQRRAAARQLVAGSALVFDPDPRTALASEDLDDSAGESDLESAYVERGLPEVSLCDSQHWLEGPNVRIADVEPPDSPRAPRPTAAGKPGAVAAHSTTRRPTTTSTSRSGTWPSSVSPRPRS